MRTGFYYKYSSPVSFLGMMLRDMYNVETIFDIASNKPIPVRLKKNC